MSTLANDLYSGAAVVGRVEAYVSFIVLSLISIGLIVGGYFLAREKFVETIGQVIEVGCVNGNCNVEYTYSVKGQSFMGRYSGSTYIPLGRRAIYYNASNPSDSSIHGHGNLLGGGLLILIGLVILAISYTNLFLVKNVKPVAAAEGVKDIINLI